MFVKRHRTHRRSSCRKSPGTASNSCCLICWMPWRRNNGGRRRVQLSCWGKPQSHSCSSQSSSMAFCAPRQLSLSLPTIIPHLTGVINDSHAQVKSAANTSLKRFGEVLENPEVKAMQSTLMKALADPTAKTANALSVLLKTRFEHYLDAPSLALVSHLSARQRKLIPRSCRS